jgi:hypothetical protein
LVSDSDVDATAWVAIAGIAGTLAGALLAPMIAEKMRRKSARMEIVTGERIEVYADLLRVTARIADNVVGWSANPLMELEETDDEVLNRLVARLQVVASEDVHKQFLDLRSQIGPFYRLLWTARISHNRELRKEDPVPGQSPPEMQRVELYGMAEDIVKNHKELIAMIRAEFDG